MRLIWPLLALVLAGAAGCGDNSKACGQGTVEGTGDLAGYCIPAAACGTGTKPDPNTGQCVPAGCTDGTVFDPTTGTCQIDPNSCQDGTVLIGGACVDPTRGLVVDVEEAPEPNGLGIIEASPAPAGRITALRPVGGTGFVIHGHIDPFRDANGDGQPDPDVDSYLVDVAGPVLLHLTADGVHGVTAGFAALANVDATSPLASWIRYGIDLSSDTSRRQLYLPAAGQYILAIGDSRTWLQYTTGGPVDAAPGGPDGDYYITIDALDTPPPVPLTTTTQTGTLGEEIQFFTLPMGSGLNDVQLDMPQPQGAAAVEVFKNTAYRGDGYESTDPFGFSVPAEVTLAGIQSTDTPVIAVDALYNYAQQPVDYTLTVTPHDATALSRTGGTASAVETALNAYYFDVSAADVTDGTQLAWNHAVRGQLVYEDLTTAASFTTLGSTAPTWTTYRGLLRLAAPGRYYFLVADPTGTAGTTQLVATSTITELTPVAISEGTATGPQTMNAFRSNPFTYDAGTTDPWQTFNATGVNTGGQLVGWYDPATTHGRLDTLTVTGGTRAPDATPVFQHPYAIAGGAIGRIVLDDPTMTYFVKVNPVAPAATPTFDLTFAPRTITDLGTIPAGSPMTSTDHTLGTTTTAGYFLFRTAPGAPTTITVHPQMASLLNTRFARLNADESALGPVVNTSNTGDDVAAFFQTGTGWTAFVVTAVTPPATAQLYDVTVAPQAPASYAETTGQAAFTDVCATGTAITFVADGSGFPATDEGLSSTTITPPAGFNFYGLPAPAFTISTNGFLAFVAPGRAAFGNQDIPDPAAPDGVVAPYWDDLHNVTACRKASGTQLIVQWDGQTQSGNLAVHVQAILDGADSSIELVWATTEAALGDSATIGLEDTAGANAAKHSFDTPNAIAAGTSRRYTPM